MAKITIDNVAEQVRGFADRTIALKRAELAKIVKDISERTANGRIEPWTMIDAVKSEEYIRGYEAAVLQVLTPIEAFLEAQARTE